MIRSLKSRASVKRITLLVVIVAVGIIGGVMLAASHAATPFIAAEAESGTKGGCVTSVNDTGASGGSAVKFVPCATGGKPAAVTTPPYWFASTAQAAYLAETNPTIKRMYYNIAATPTSFWIGYADVNWSGWSSLRTSYLDKAKNTNTVMQLVMYAIPDRDCGGYAAGGDAQDIAQYEAWADHLVNVIGNDKAIIIIEPDAISFCNNNATTRHVRATAMTYAAKAIHDRAPNAAAYIHAGAAEVSLDYAAQALVDTGVKYIRGFAMNVSSDVSTAAQQTYADQLVAKLAGSPYNTPNVHYVVDTSRNGIGHQPNPGAPFPACNDLNDALGTRPTSNTNDPLADAYLWVKPPGESDGAGCHSSLGQTEPKGWYPLMAQNLVKNAINHTPPTVEYWSCPSGVSCQ